MPTALTRNDLLYPPTILWENGQLNENYFFPMAKARASLQHMSKNIVAKCFVMAMSDSVTGPTIPTEKCLFCVTPPNIVQNRPFIADNQFSVRNLHHFVFDFPRSITTYWQCCGPWHSLSRLESWNIQKLIFSRVIISQSRKRRIIDKYDNTRSRSK